MPPLDTNTGSDWQNMAPASPTIARWELALRLRERRKHLGMDIKTITDRLDFSRNYWSAVENNRTILAEEKLKLLLEVFEFDAGEVRELLALRDAAKERGWWTQYSAQLDDEMKRLYGLEHGAESLQTYEGLLITGLLQTEDYARAVIASDPANSPVHVEQLVDIRLRRQERLRSDDRLRLTALMSEAALCQQTGGVDVLHRQLLHLSGSIEELPDSLDVRVVPFATTPGGALGSSTLYLMRFASPRLPMVAWQESTVGMHGVIEGGDVLRRLSLTYAQALASSLSREESLELIKRRAKGLE